ncbi:MAG TPA: TPM domain-containing protein [Vicinamibacterales bacterium]|nr:TPM domain-containing protein [Vicinamibacterales bacterium]
MTRRVPARGAHPLAGSLLCAALLGLALRAAAALPSRAELPLLTAPVHDFAGVIDETSEAELTRRILALRRATGDVIVVVTVDTFAPFADIREYAVKLFENHGRGIGERGKDNGLLIVVAVRDRRVAIEVGYGLEEIVPDGYAGEVVRTVLVPAFRAGDYGGGLLAAVTRIGRRIAERKGVRVDELPPVRRPAAGVPWPFLLFLLFAIVLLSIAAGGGMGPRRRRSWTRGPWSGWTSGVGPFGMGPFGGGFGGFGGSGGGFGGFGGFGGGRSGGGGAAGGW